MQLGRGRRFLPHHIAICGPADHQRVGGGTPPVIAAQRGEMLIVERVGIEGLTSFWPRRLGRRQRAPRHRCLEHDLAGHANGRPDRRYPATPWEGEHHGQCQSRHDRCGYQPVARRGKQPAQRRAVLALHLPRLKRGEKRQHDREDLGAWPGGMPEQPPGHHEDKHHRHQQQAHPPRKSGDREVLAVGDRDIDGDLGFLRNGPQRDVLDHVGTRHHRARADPLGRRAPEQVPGLAEEIFCRVSQPGHRVHAAAAGPGELGPEFVERVPGGGRGAQPYVGGSLILLGARFVVAQRLASGGCLGPGAGCRRSAV